MSRPTVQLEPPTAMSCLRCQLLGRRKLLCSRQDACASLPLAFPLGPLMLAGCLGLAVLFFLYVI